MNWNAIMYGAGWVPADHSREQHDRLGMQMVQRADALSDARGHTDLDMAGRDLGEKDD